MNGPLPTDLADYLVLRRALGYRLVRPEKLLRQFLTHLHDAGIEHVSVDAALDWAVVPTAGPGSNWSAYRLSVVRGFATYLHAVDPAHEVPAPDMLPTHPQRAVPYLYSRSEIAALIGATACLSTPLRQATFATLIGLLAVTGMRIGEAIALDRSDVDLTGALLVIRHGKFDKARELALHPSTVTALGEYQRLRNHDAPRTGASAFFVSMAGTRLLYCNVHHAFRHLVGVAGLAPRSAACRPRIHDLRHTFAVEAMRQAYATGEDGQRTLTLLSTWLGHVNPGSTYWYLSASPELMALAGQRLETYLAGRS
jgi:integrase